MKHSMHRPVLWVLFITALFAMMGKAACLQADENEKQQYTETIAVLQILYDNEIHARNHYLAFADVALKEGHINIAHLFKAIANSEEVHSRNFSRILKELGVDVPIVDLAPDNVSTTKENLKYATEVELSEIDTEYPRYIHRISPELHKETLEYVNFAWSAERQHRELLKKIQSGTGIFFSMLVKKFRSNPSSYYVNQHCGATVAELPIGKCPICYKPLDTYLAIPRPVQDPGHTL